MVMAINGAAKLFEESGELLTELGKKLAYYDTDCHPDGAGSLEQRILCESSDVLAAIDFFICANELNVDQVHFLAKDKLHLYEGWKSSTDASGIIRIVKSISEMNLILAECLTKTPSTCTATVEEFQIILANVRAAILYTVFDMEINIGYPESMISKIKNKYERYVDWHGNSESHGYQPAHTIKELLNRDSISHKEKRGIRNISLEDVSARAMSFGSRFKEGMS